MFDAILTPEQKALRDEVRFVREAAARALGELGSRRKALRRSSRGPGNIPG